MIDINPADLPDADEVDVYVLVESDETRLFRFMPPVGERAGIRLEGGAAAVVVRLFRSLPPGETKRCHNPPFGFRFYAGGRAAYEFSVCWSCNNAFGRVSGTDAAFSFDGEHERALELLREAQRVTGVKVSE